MGLSFLQLQLRKVLVVLPQPRRRLRESDARRFQQGFPHLIEIGLYPT